jgi:hypothetical protein
VIAVQNDHGFAPQVFMARADKAEVVFEEGCVGPLLVGDDLDAMRWVTLGERTYLFMVVLHENPDALAQSFALVDLEGGCKAAHNETVTLAKEGEVVAPADLRGGVSVNAAGDGVSVFDQPEYLRLRGAEEDVLVLRRIRQRRLRNGGADVVADETRIEVVAPTPLVPTWRSPEVVLELGELIDGEPSTAFVPRPGAAGELVLDSPRPLVLLEVQHGCGEATSAAGLIHDGAAQPLDALAPTAPWVRAIGQAKGAPHARTLVALATPAKTLGLTLMPETPACLRELRAYAFRD